MDHPFIGSLKDKTMEDLTEIISKLTKQLTYVMRMGRHDVANQIQMALSTYRGEMQRRQMEMWDKKRGDLDKKIDIS